MREERGERDSGWESVRNRWERSRTRWQVSYFSASLEKVLESEEEREGKKRVR